MKALQKKQRPLIRYAGSAAETSIGSKPIGSELNPRFYSKEQVLSRHWSCACHGDPTMNLEELLSTLDWCAPPAPASSTW